MSWRAFGRITGQGTVDPTHMGLTVEWQVMNDLGNALGANAEVIAVPLGLTDTELEAALKDALAAQINIEMQGPVPGFFITAANIIGCKL